MIMFYKAFEKEVEQRHLRDYVDGEIELVIDTEESEPGTIPIHQSEELMYAIEWPDQKVWHNLFTRAVKIAEGSRACYIAEANWYNSLETDETKFTAYRIFKRAIKKFGPDQILLSGVLINLFSLKEKYHSVGRFVNDVLIYGAAYSDLKSDNWKELFEIADNLSDLEISLAEEGLDRSRKKVLKLDLKVREKMFKLKPGDADNLFNLIFDSYHLGLTFKRDSYYALTRNLAKQGKLHSFSFIGEGKLVSLEEVERDLSDLL
jgi:hypothetical protein